MALWQKKIEILSAKYVQIIKAGVLKVDEWIGSER